MKNLLKGASVYLAGAVEHNDSPANWRVDITKNLFNPMGVRVYNPLVKPDWLGELARSADPVEYRTMMESDDPEIWQTLREVRVLCKQMVAYSDFVVVNFPKKFTVGTIEEITLAVQMGKPVLIYSPDGTISTWLPNMLLDSVLFDTRSVGPKLDYFDHCHFADWESLYVYLEGVDNGTVEVNKFKWLFMSYFDNDLVKAQNEVSDHVKT